MNNAADLTAEVRMPGWMRALRVFWAGLLIVGFSFSILMAAWGDLREALMAKVIADRHNKSFLLRAPVGALVWVGDELLGEARMHELAAGEPPDSDLAVEGMSVFEPRVYLRDGQMLKAAVRRNPGDDTAALVARLAPGATLLWAGPDAEFTPVLMLTPEGLDYACLCRFEFPHWDAGNERFVPSAFLLRLELEGSRVFTVSQERIWSDQIRVPGKFWATREQFDGLPPHLEGQVKTVWEWHLQVETDHQSWVQRHVPAEHQGTKWAPRE